MVFLMVSLTASCPASLTKGEKVDLTILLDKAPPVAPIKANIKGLILSSSVKRLAVAPVP